MSVIGHVSLSFWVPIHGQIQNFPKMDSNLPGGLDTIL